jgi:preprotein translocase subunit SecE
VQHILESEGLMFGKLVAYFGSVRTEMSKVSWPTRTEMIESTRVVLIFSAAMAVLLFFIDRILSLALEAII